MKKSTFILGISLALLFCVPVTAEITYQLTQVGYPIVVNGVQLKSDLPALNYNGNTYLPLRNIAEAVGANIQWDIVNKQVVISNDKKYPKSPTPAPTLTPTLKPAPTPSPKPTLAQSPTQAPTPTPSPTPSLSPSPSQTPTPTYTPSQTLSPAPTPTPTPIITKIGWDFAGFYNGFIYTLSNGQRWQQTSNECEITDFVNKLSKSIDASNIRSGLYGQPAGIVYKESLRPNVLIYTDSYGNYKIRVDGCTNTPTVIKLN